MWACATRHSPGKVDQINGDAVTGLIQFRMSDDGHIFEWFALVKSSYLENNEDRNSAWSGGQREQLDNRESTAVDVGEEGKERSKRNRA